MRPETIAVHAGKQEGANAPISPPLVTSSTYAWEDFDQAPAYEYSRYGNPNREALEVAVAALEGARFGVAFGSGMAAMAACFEFVEAGDHVLIADDLYGGTSYLGDRVFARRGIEHSTFDSLNAESVRSSRRPNTKLCIFESPTNPNLRIADIRAVCEIAHETGMRVVFDNTFATPLLQNPLALGADVVVHSTTKYLAGHSDVVGGAAVTNEPDLHAALLGHAKAAGGVPGPFDCWQALRGLRTLCVRFSAQQTNAMRIARFMEAHPAVSKVHYPGLPSHEGHELAARQMRGFGAMVSAEIGTTAEDAKRFSRSLGLITMAASLGGIESLVSYPPVLSHKAMGEAERLRRGIPPNLLRFSIGIENGDDLLDDVEQALQSL